MMSGLLHVGGRLLLGIGGVTVLASSANTLCIVAEGVRRVFVSSYSYSQEPSSLGKADEENKIWSTKRCFFPYSSSPTGELVWSLAFNLALATLTMYLFNRFAPSMVTSANELVHRAVPIQFTPNHIPLFKLFGY